MVPTVFNVMSLHTGFVQAANAGGPSSGGASANTFAPLLACSLIGALISVCIVVAADASVLKAPGFRGNSAFVGSLVTSVCSSASLGSELACICMLFGATLDVQLAVFLAAVAVAVNAAMLMCRTDVRLVQRLNAVIVITALLIVAMAVITILTRVPAGVVAGGAAAVGMMFMHSQANVLLRVPDRYLIEWQRYMTQKWTVRGSIPVDSRPLRSRDVADDLMIIQAEYRAGVVFSDLFVLFGFMIVCLTVPQEPNIEVTIGLAVFAVSLLLVLLLKPRTAGSPFDRMLLRGTAVGVLGIVLATLYTHEQWNFLVPYVVCTLLVFGMILAGVMPALQSGFQSLMMSRIGDGLATLGLVLIAPSAVFASGCMDLIRGLMA
jgi:hypothetical protein